MKCGRSYYLLHLKAQDAGHREVHGLAKVTQLTRQLDFDSLLLNMALFQKSSKSTEAKPSALLTSPVSRPPPCSTRLLPLPLWALRVTSIEEGPSVKDPPPCMN